MGDGGRAGRHWAGTTHDDGRSHVGGGRGRGGLGFGLGSLPGIAIMLLGAERCHWEGV